MKLDQENTSPNENGQSKRIPIKELRIDTSFEDKEETKSD
jgi:putative aminopeptidase FrvX